MPRRPLGAHWLAFNGALQPGQEPRLEDAVRVAVQAGCTLFELACSPVNGMDAVATAKAVRAGGLTTVSYCRFFPNGDPPPFGDPLGESPDRDHALVTWRKDLAFIRNLQDEGLNVTHITGPSGFVVGKEYTGGRADLGRMLHFYREVGELLSEGDPDVCIEYLRAGEDNGAIGGVSKVCELLEALDDNHFWWHADIYHMRQRGEKPHEAIRKGARYLRYLHAHGDHRLPPGAYRLAGNDDATDEVNWHLVSLALNEAQYTGPVVPEPFGADIRAQVPALGEGLPPAIDPGEYYTQASGHLRSQGII